MRKAIIPQAAMNPALRTVELRQASSRQMEPLFAEERRLWLDQLHWDYRPSTQLISKFIDAKSLCGYAAFTGGEAVGYGFYIVEETKGLIGGLYVTPKCDPSETGKCILGQILASMRAAPGMRRIEAQLMPFGAPLDHAFVGENFRLHPRQFMLLPLKEWSGDSTPVARNLRIERWDDRYFEPCARLIYAAYAGHVDSAINDQYCSEAGALKFLKNIILLPGCGQFRADASFVVRPAASERLVAAVLTSCVSHGVGHTTQICVLPGYQGQGLGKRLMAASVQALRASRFHALSLTVTSANASAVKLYERLGFHTLKRFSAAVWQV